MFNNIWEQNKGTIIFSFHSVLVLSEDKIFKDYFRLSHSDKIRRLPGRRALVVVFIKNMLFEIIVSVVFECL